MSVKLLLELSMQFLLKLFGELLSLLSLPCAHVPLDFTHLVVLLTQGFVRIFVLAQRLVQLVHLLQMLL